VRLSYPVRASDVAEADHISRLRESGRYGVKVTSEAEYETDYPSSIISSASAIVLLCKPLKIELEAKTWHRKYLKCRSKPVSSLDPSR
jgi:hypothetical protein